MKIEDDEHPDCTVGDREAPVASGEDQVASQIGLGERRHQGVPGLGLRRKAIRHHLGDLHQAVPKSWGIDFNWGNHG